MKVRILEDKKEPFGVELIAVSKQDNVVQGAVRSH